MGAFADLLLRGVDAAELFQALGRVGEGAADGVRHLANGAVLDE